MYRTIRFFFVLLIVLSSNTIVAAQSGLKPQLAISPSRVVLQPDEVNATKSVTVLNLGSKPMQVEVSVQNWDFDEDNDDYGWFPAGIGASRSGGRTSNDNRSDSLNPNSRRYNPGRKK